MKICKKCVVCKPLEDFSPHKAGKMGRKARCKACIREDYLFYTADKEKLYKQNRISWLKTRYNLTVEEYETILNQQGGCCAICGSINPGKPRNFCVDHDHNCCPGKTSCGNCIRGLICDGCNIVLGRAYDDPKILRNAADYLETYILRGGYRG